MNGKNGARGAHLSHPEKGHIGTSYTVVLGDVVSLWWPLHKNCWHTPLLSRTKAERQKQTGVIFRARYDSYFPTQ